MLELVIYPSAARPTKRYIFTARRTTCRDGQAAVERRLLCAVRRELQGLPAELGFGLQLLLGMQCSSSYETMHNLAPPISCLIVRASKK